MSGKQLIPLLRNADEHYRYKMPNIAARTQSSGNGIKTLFLNADKISQAIGRPIESLSQWLSTSIGVSTKLMDKRQILLNGTHDHKILLEKLYEFIDTFVLCPVCHNPETRFVKENKDLHLLCSSCGNNSKININKNNERLIKWFFSNLESQNNSIAIGPSSKSKSGASQHRSGKPSADTKPDTKNENDDSKIDVQELEGILATLGGVPKDPSSQEMDSFFLKMKQMLQADPEKVTDTAIYNELQDFLSKWNTKESWLIQVIFYSLFEDSPKDMLEIMKKRRNFLILFLVKEADQRGFLSVLTNFICYVHPELMTSAPIIFYTLFDNEIIEEQTFNTWKTSKPARQFEPDKSKSDTLRNVILKDFFDWLANAPYEEETHTAEKEEEDNPDEKEEEDQNDIDIDAI